MGENTWLLKFLSWGVKEKRYSRYINKRCFGDSTFQFFGDSSILGETGTCLFHCWRNGKMFYFRYNLFTGYVLPLKPKLLPLNLWTDPKTMQSGKDFIATLLLIVNNLLKLNNKKLLFLCNGIINFVIIMLWRKF